jgi:hypothetical protein
LAVSLEVIRTLTTRARTEGVDAARRELESYASAQQKIAAAGDGMRVANDNATRSVISAATAFDRLERSIDPVAKANAQLAAAQAKVQRALNDGSVDAGRAANVLALLAKRHSDAVSAAQQGSESLDQHAKSVGLARHEWINLSRQLQDVGVSLAGGQSPLTVLVQQGSQIADVFSSSRGGAGAALKDFGATIGRYVLNPLTLLTAALGGASYAAYQFAQQQATLDRALNGVGRLSGATSGELRSMALDSTRSGGLAYGQGIEAAAAYAGAGIGRENISTLLADTQRFAHAFGVDLEDARNEIGQIVGGEGLGALEKRFGPVSFATKEWVRSLEASGRFAEATALKTRLLDEETRKAKDTASGLQKAWEGVIRWATTPVFGLGPKIDRMIRGPSLEEQLAAARGDYFYLRAQRRGDASSYPGEAAAEQRVRELERKLQDERDRPARERRDLELNRLSTRAASIIDEQNPDLAQLRGLREARNALSKLLGSDEGLAKLGDRANDARGALANLDRQIEAWRSTTDRMRDDAALAVREITARTFAEREAVAMERAKIQAIRDGKTELQASIAAESERAKLLAESARKAEDYARAGRDQLSLAGLTPYERGRQQILNEARDIREQYLPNSATPMAREFDMAGAAARSLAGALTAAAGAIGRLIPLSEWQKPAGQALPMFAQGAGGGGQSLYNAIIRAEGTGRFGDPYNTSLGYMRSPKPLVEMTMAESLAWGDQVRRAQGLNSSAKGAFQITNTTQRDAMKALGLGPDDLFSVENQNRMADWIFKTQGIGAWEGFKRGGAQIANDNSSIGGKLDKGLADRLEAYDIEQIGQKIKDVNNGIADQNRLLDAQTAALGADNSTIAGVIEAQKLLNYFTTQRIAVDETLKRKILEVGEAEAERARKEEALARERRNIIADRDFVRGSFNDTLGGVARAAMRGENVGAALEQASQRILDNALNLSVGRLTEGLFGATGTMENGLLGGLLGGILPGFGGGKSVAEANITAGVVNVTGGIGGTLGGAANGSGAGGLLGGLLDTIGGLFSSHDIGGAVGAPGHKVAAPLSAFVGAPHFAAGGGIPIIAHEGEIILNAAQQANVAAAIKAARGATNAKISGQNGNSAALIGPIVFNLPLGSDSRSFQQSEGQITAMMARAIANAQRYA